MATIQLIRKPIPNHQLPITNHQPPITNRPVRGTITLPFEKPCPLTYDTLENADYLIPAGTYPLRMTWSPKFKKPLPEILDVPDRYGIRIHRGTLPEHSHGCILTDMAGISFLQILFNQIMNTNDEHENDDNYERESATITIMDASPA